jgi:hypothetical protein
MRANDLVDREIDFHWDIVQNIIVGMGDKSDCRGQQSGRAEI